MKSSKPIVRCQAVTRETGSFGVTMKYCFRECVPGLEACSQHANAETLLLLVQSLRHDMAEMRRELARAQRAVKRAKGGA